MATWLQRFYLLVACVIAGTVAYKFNPHVSINIGALSLGLNEFISETVNLLVVSIIAVFVFVMYIFLDQMIWERRRNNQRRDVFEGKTLNDSRRRS